MNRIHFLLAAVLALGCADKGNSALSITKVVPPTASTSATGPSTCTVDPTTLEVSYLAYNPAENQGVVGAVVSNQTLSTVALNPLLRLDTSTFLPHQAVIDYEVLSGARQVGRQVSPVSGVEVPGGGGTGAIAVIMFPRPSDVAGLADGTFIRTTFRIEGTLNDQSKAHTNEREYIFRICNTPGCAGNKCL